MISQSGSASAVNSTTRSRTSSNSASSAIWAAMADIEKGDTGEIPKTLKDTHYSGAAKVGLERQLLGHKVDRNGLDAIELSQLVLKFTRAVGAIDLVELKLLFHGGFLSLC